MIIIKKLLHLTIIIAAGYGSSNQLGLWDGSFNGQQLLYYTILSNLIIFFYYVYLQRYSATKTKNNPWSNNIRGAFTLMIIITGLIYHLLLAPQVSGLNPYGVDPLPNFMVHTYVPLAVFLDWIIFVKIKDTKVLKPIYWLGVPLTYWIVSLFYASFKIPFDLTGDYYAYFFIDINHLGFWKVLINICFLSFIFLILGYFLKLLKKYQYVLKKF